MQVDIPREINKLLRRYVLENDKINRELATIYILENFLKQYYNIKDKEDKK